LDEGTPLTIDTTVAREIGARLGINLGNGYAERIINKYYAANSAHAPDKSNTAMPDRNRTTSS
jgi:hypothetical protein